MRAARTLLVNTLLLTAVSLLMRGVGVVFQLYLARELGASGVGLLQLILSVYALAVTVAASGIKLAATRLVAEELGAGGGDVRRALDVCLILCGVTGGIAALLLYGGASALALRWLDDLRAVLSLRVLALSLPFTALASAFSGYFTAVQRLAKPALLQVAEQAVRVGATALALRYAVPLGTMYACAAVALGTLAGEVFGSAGSLALCRADLRRISARPRRRAPMAMRLLRISAPLALSLYARMALATAESLLTPRGLRQSGMGAEASAAAYGVIEGMVFPVLMFPCAVVQVLSELMAPELTESQVTGRGKRIRYMAERVFRFVLPFGVWMAAAFVFFSEEIGAAVFSDPSAARYLRLLAPMALIVCADAVCDGMLRGLGEYAASLRYSIADSLLGVAMVLTLLPRYGIAGYLFTTISTKVVNCLLGLGRLCRVTGWTPPVARTLGAAACAALAALGVRAAFGLLPGLAALPPAAAAVGLIAAATAAYAALLRLSSALSREDVAWLRGLLRK